MIDRLSRLLLAGLLMMAACLLVLLAILAAGVAVYFALLPVWGAAPAALGGTGFLLIVAMLTLLSARGLSRSKRPVGDKAPDAEVTKTAAELGRSAADLLQSNARGATMLALGAGIILGLSPRLRRKLLGQRW